MTRNRRICIVLMLFPGICSMCAVNAQPGALFSDTDWSAYTAEPVGGRLGLQIHHLTEIDRKREHFGVVASIRMEWMDPGLVFEPDSDASTTFRIFTSEGVREYTDSNGLLAPGFLVLNRQGRLDVSESAAVVFRNGSAVL